MSSLPYLTLALVILAPAPFLRAAPGPAIRIENRMKFPGSDVSFPSDQLLVFNNNSQGHATATKWHNRNTLRIHSEGSEPLVIRDLKLINPEGAGTYTPFRLETIDGAPVAAAPFPLTIPGGKYSDWVISFAHDKPEFARTFRRMIQLITNAGDREITLRGGNMVRVEGGNELNVQQIIDLFGFKTNIAGISPSSFIPTPAEIRRGEQGDLVWSKLFTQADPTQPLRVIFLAAFKGPGAPSVKLLSPDKNEVVAGLESTAGTEWHQSLYPRSAANPAEPAGFSAAKVPGAFRISVGGYTSGTGNDKGRFIDQITGIRVYRAVDEAGKTIPYDYIVLQDYVGPGCGKGSFNCDWNDSMIYIRNMKPVADPSIRAAIPGMTVPAGQPFAFAVGDAWNPGYPGNRLTLAARLQDGGKLPAWLNFDSEFASFTGTAPAGQTAQLSIAVSAVDANGIRIPADARTTFTLRVPAQ